MRAHLMAPWTTLILLSVFAAPPVEAGVFRSADESARRFFQAIQNDDQRLYGSVASRIVLMATPDFGVPMALPAAREAFGKCRVLEISPERPEPRIKGLKSTTAKLSCPPDGLGESFEIEFVSRRGELLVAYPGGQPPLQPRAESSPG